MSINKLVAGTKGDAGNSTGSDIANSVNGLIDKVQGGINPLKADNVILSGSSITEQSTDTAAKSERVAEVAMHLGFSGSIVNVSVSGNKILENSNYWVSNVRGQSYATKNDACILTTNGNDVSAGRPYSTDPEAMSGLSSNLAIDWVERYSNAALDVGVVIPTACTFRAYTSAPSVDVHDLASTGSNGSLPYNDGIFSPLAGAKAPSFFFDGSPTINGYDFTKDRFWCVTEGDGVHLHPSIQHCFAEFLLLETKKIFDESTADVAGKTIIAYPQNPADTLNKESGYTPNIMLNAMVIDTGDSKIPHLSFIYNGGSLVTAGGSGSAGNARVADADLHGDLLLSNYIYATSSGDLTQQRASYAEATLSGLKSGTTGSLTMACCRDGASSTNRQGVITINGVNAGIHDAANDVASNQIGPIPFRADIDGNVTLRTEPLGDVGFSYIGTIKYVFD